MSDREGDRADRQPHLKDYLHVVSARRWTLISTLVIVVLGAAVWVLLQPPIYRAEALLLIEPGKVNLTDFKGVYDPTLGQLGTQSGQREFLETQSKLIVCRPLLEKTFEEFRFGSLSKYRDVQDPILGFSRRFSVRPERQSRLVWVTFDWEDPEEAARALDYLVAEYIADYRRRAVGVTERGLDALKQKADELRPRVQKKADELQQFMVKNNMVSLEKTQNIVVDRLKELNRSLSDVERQKIEFESVYLNIQQALDQKRPLEDMPEVADSTTVRDLKLEYIRTKQECSGLSERFGPNHPEVVAAQARLRAIAEKMQQEISSVLAAARAQLQRATRQEADIRDKLDLQQKQVMRFNELAVQYDILKSAKETLSRTYAAIEKRIQEIEITMAAGSREDNIFVMTKPRVPVRPARPRKTLTVAVAGILGLFLGVGLCFFVDYLDTTIKTKEDVEQVLGVPTIGYVPSVRGRDLGGTDGHPKRPLELTALDKPRSSVAEAFRSIRTALAFSATNGAPKRFLVTSSTPKEGKTLVSLNVAMTLAQTDKKVVLVDADMRRPRLHKILGVSGRPGLSNLLAGEGVSDVQEALQQVAGARRLSFLPSGPIPPNPADLLGSDRMKALLDELSEQFDAVVIDSPPALNVTDPVVLCQHGAGVIMVIRSFATQRKLVQRAAELLGQGRGKMLGVVLNNVDAHRAGYYAYDRYYQEYYYYGDDDSGRPRKRRRHRAGGSYG